MEMVNGFVCKTCTDVGYAKKNIDPAHPKDGPVDINQGARADPAAGRDERAVKFGGALQRLIETASVAPTRLGGAEAGQRLNLTV